jgi:hypothetical protein
MLASAAASAWSTYLHWLPYRRSMRFFHLPKPIEIRCLGPRRLHVLALQDRHLWAAEAVAAWGVGPAGVSAESHGISYTAEPCGIEQFTVEGCCQDRRGDGSRAICVAPGMQTLL